MIYPFQYTVGDMYKIYKDFEYFSWKHLYLFNVYKANVTIGFILHHYFSIHYNMLTIYVLWNWNILFFNDNILSLKSFVLIPCFLQLFLCSDVFMKGDVKFSFLSHKVWILHWCISLKKILLVNLRISRNFPPLSLLQRWFSVKALI